VDPADNSNASHVSPSALIKASRRIQDLYSTRGDLCVCLGTLFYRTKGDGADQGWTCAYPARIKVVSENGKSHILRIDPIDQATSKNKHTTILPPKSKLIKAKAPSGGV